MFTRTPDPDFRDRFAGWTRDGLPDCYRKRHQVSSETGADLVFYLWSEPASIR